MKNALIILGLALPFLLPAVANAAPAPISRPISRPISPRPIARQSDWREIRRNDDRGWQSERWENGQRIVVTGFEQNKNAVVVGVVYNRNGSVQSSDRVNLSRGK